MRLPLRRCGRIVAIWLIACALLTGACTSTNGATSVTLVTPAPVDSAALSIAAARGSRLVAYRARDGSTRWTYTSQSENYDLDYGIRYGAGLVIGFTFSNSEPDHLTLVAVGAPDGRLRWHVRLPGLIAPQVAVARDYVVVELGTLGSPGPLRVIRASDGAQVHDIPLAGAGWIAADGDLAFECTHGAVLTAYRLEDGQPMWSVPIAPAAAAPEQPCGLSAGDGIVFGHVMIPTAQGQQMNELVAVRESDGHRLWQKPLGLDLLKDGRGYYFVEPGSVPSTGQIPTPRSLGAYRTADGKMLWQIPAGTEDNFNIAGDGNVLVFAQGGDLRAVRASDGASLWHYPHPPDHSLGVVNVTGGLVFALSTGGWSMRHPPPLGTDTRQHLLVLDAGNGRLYWQMPLDLSAIAIGTAISG